LKRLSYYARSAYRTPLVVLGAVAAYFGTHLTHDPAKRTRIANAYCQSMLKLMGIRVVSNRDLFQERGVIFAPNHISYQDIMVMLAMTNGRFVAAEKARTIPIFGGGAAQIGCIFVNLELGGTFHHLLEEAGPALESGDNIIIFPEGQTTTRPLLPFKKGAFGLSMQSGAPIMPVVIRYSNIEEVAWGFVISEESLFSHLMGFLGNLRDEEIRLIALPKVDPSDFEDAETLRQAIRAAMQRVFDDESLDDADLDALDLYGLKTRAHPPQRLAE